MAVENNKRWSVFFNPNISLSVVDLFRGNTSKEREAFKLAKILQDKGFFVVGQLLEESKRSMQCVKGIGPVRANFIDQCLENKIGFGFLPNGQEIRPRNTFKYPVSASSFYNEQYRLS